MDNKSIVISAFKKQIKGNGESFVKTHNSIEGENFKLNCSNHQYSIEYKDIKIKINKDELRDLVDHALLEIEQAEARQNSVKIANQIEELRKFLEE